MSFVGSIQMICLSMLTCTIEYKGGPNKMAAASQIEARSSLFFRSVRNVAATTLSKITLKVSIAIPTVQLCTKEKAEHKAV